MTKKSSCLHRNVESLSKLNKKIVSTNSKDDWINVDMKKRWQKCSLCPTNYRKVNTTRYIRTYIHEAVWGSWYTGIAFHFKLLAIRL